MDPVDPLAEHTATWLLRWARTQLDPTHPVTSLGPPPASVRNAQPAIVILTVFDGRTASGFTSRGGDLLDAVMRAVGEALVAAPTVKRLQLDIVLDEPVPIAVPGDDGTLPDTEATDAWHRLTSFQDGLVVTSQEQSRWLAPTQLVLQGMARKGRDVSAATPSDVLTAALHRLGLPTGARRDPNLALWLFSTAAWIEDAARDRALPLVQGVVPIERFDRDRLLASAIAGGEYLLRIMQDDGSFVYTLDPWLATQSRTAYNVVRHAGTATALFDLAAVTGDNRFLSGATRAMTHLAGWYRPGAQDDLTYVLDSDGKAKLGAFGLALLALSHKIELAPEPADRELAFQIGRQIVALQQPDGSFASYLRIRGNEPTGSVSLYYPGEAMLGLARVAAQGIDDGFMAAAHRGAEYLIAARKGRSKLPPDAWLIQALDVLHTNDPKPSYVEHSMAISRSMLTDQFPPDAPPLYAGGFGPEPIRSTRTTARVEGLVAACRLGFRVGDQRAPGILAAIQRTVPHLLPMQYDADNSFFLDNPEVVDGAMRGGLDDAEIRIDYVQHHMSGMLGLAGLMQPAPDES
jgi:hypothetical protein